MLHWDMGGLLISSHPVLTLTKGGNNMGIRDYLDDKAPIPGFLNRNGEEPPRPIPSLEQQKYIPGRRWADKPPEDLATKMEDELRPLPQSKNLQ